MSNPLPAVVVTGASSGIGLAIARRLSQSGFHVFAGVRNLSPASGPADSPHLSEILLDVTQPESLAAARRDVESQLRGTGVFALINNAGIGDLIPLEFTPMDRFRHILEVNLFGVLAATQEFLPLLHQGKGRIVNIGSVGGMVTIPFAASLTASKHAIESLSDALRLELYAAGLHVTCIQPASINSGSAEKLAAQTEATVAGLPPEGRRRYGDVLRKFSRIMLQSETGGSSPDVVAQAVLEVLRAKNPPTRRLVGKDRHLMKFLARGLPDAVRDAIFRRLFLGHPTFGSMPGRGS